MAVAAQDFYRLGGLIIPVAYRPQFCLGVEPPEWDGSTNLFGGRAGLRGGYTCTLRWNIIDEDVYKWWYSGEAIGAIIPRDSEWGTVDEVVLPDPTGRGDPINNRAHHGRFDYAVIHRIERTEARERQYLGFGLERRPYLIGGAVVRITHIGDVPPL